MRYTLKTPYRYGTTHLVFAPHSRWRAEVTPAGRGKPTVTDLRTEAERHRAMSWAQQLARVFGSEIETCEQCSGKVKMIASIEDPTVIGAILGHLASRELPAWSRPSTRGHPKASLSFRNGVGRSGPGWVHAAGAGRLRGWRSALHKSGRKGENCGAVCRCCGKQADPTAIAARILGWADSAHGV